MTLRLSAWANLGPKPRLAGVQGGPRGQGGAGERNSPRHMQYLSSSCGSQGIVWASEVGVQSFLSYQEDS